MSGDDRALGIEPDDATRLVAGGAGVVPEGGVPDDATRLAAGGAGVVPEGGVPDDATRLVAGGAGGVPEGVVPDDATRRAAGGAGVVPDDATRLGARAWPGGGRGLPRASAPATATWPGAPGAGRSTLPVGRVVRVRSGQQDTYAARVAAPQHVLAPAPAPAASMPQHDDVRVRESRRRAGRRGAATVIGIGAAVVLTALVGLVALLAMHPG
ncbi:hypothetical protein ET495_01490 [Xylanimonas allomyrinae]|uniref:Uncharacterized protein n=1 Tax=Xylanimonas allomyrinae TaxID=2509459 RepID=A0A4P6EVW4_9MICO|nr:hypothetical protein [Xylanimonas allomyrinae]QAY62168.1 hypothetical protein ET495_01490 [Xylanimonas allomyrinae]